MVGEGRLVVVVVVVCEGRLVVMRERGRGRQRGGGLRQCHGVDIAVGLFHLQLCVRERERPGMRRGRNMVGTLSYNYLLRSL